MAEAAYQDSRGKIVCRWCALHRSYTAKFLQITSDHVKPGQYYFGYCENGEAPVWAYVISPLGRSPKQSRGRDVMAKPNIGDPRGDVEDEKPEMPREEMVGLVRERV